MAPSDELRSAGRRRGDHPGPLAYIWWAVTGVAASVGVAGMLTIGAPVLILAIAMTLAGIRTTRLRNGAAWLALVGASSMSWYIAWLNRDGPGVVCHATRTEGECDQEWSPWPFVGVGVAMVAVGVVLAVRARQGRRGSVVVDGRVEPVELPREQPDA